MKIKILTLISIIGSASSSFAADPSPQCPVFGPTQSHVRIELPASGWKKLVQWSAQQGLRAAESHPDLISIADRDFSPKAGDCTADKLKQMSTGQQWSNCYGLPKCWVEGSKCTMDDVAATEPAKFSLKNVQVNNLKFGDLIMGKCDLNACQVSIPIQDVSVSTDLSGTSISNSSHVFAVKGMNADLSPPAGKQVLLKATAQIDSQGRIVKLLQLDTDKVSFGLTLPPGSIHLSLPLNDDKKNIQEKAAVLAYNELKGPLKLPPAKTPDKMAEIVRRLPPSELRDQAVSHAVSGAAAAFRFNSVDSADLFRTIQWAATNLDNDPGFARIIEDSVGTDVLPRVIDKLNVELQGLPLLHSAVVTSVPIVRPQNSLDLNGLKDELNRQENDLKTLRTQLDAGTPSSVSTAYSSLDLDNRRLKGVVKTLDHLWDQTDAIPLLEDLENQWKSLATDVDAMIRKPDLSSSDATKLSLMQTQLKDNVATLANSIDIAKTKKGLDEQVALWATYADVDPVLQTVQMGVGVCIECGKNSIRPDVNPKRTDFKADKNYDIGLQVSLKTINEYMNVMYKNKLWDLCVKGGKLNRSGCDEYDFAAGAPTLVWSDPPGTLQLKIPQITRNGIVSAGGTIDIKIAADLSAHRLVVYPTDMNMKWVADHSTVWTSLMSLVEQATLVVPLAEDYGLYKFKGDIMGALGSPSTAMPTDFQLTDVQADEKAITLYGNLNPQPLSDQTLQGLLKSSN